MKKLFIAIVVGSLLVGGIAQADTLIPQCAGKEGLFVDCPQSEVEDTGTEVIWKIQNLNVVGYVISAIGQITNLATQTLTFLGNSYTSITASFERMYIRASSITFSKWNGTGNCWVTKSLDGTKTKWHWTDNSGVDQATTSLAGVPVQCLTNN